MGDFSVPSVSMTDRDIPVMPDQRLSYETFGFRGSIITMPLPHFEPEDRGE
jgi:hypothetical protein